MLRNTVERELAIRAGAGWERALASWDARLNPAERGRADAAFEDLAECHADDARVFAWCARAWYYVENSREQLGQPAFAANRDRETAAEMLDRIDALDLHATANRAPENHRDTPRARNLLGQIVVDCQ